MLGPAEFREIDEAMHEDKLQGVRTVNGPYLTSQFAVGKAVAAAATAGLKAHALTYPVKR